MLKLSNKLKIYLYSAFILTGIAVLLMTLALLFSYDRSLNYFSSSVIYSIFRALCYVSVAWFFTAMFLIPKGQLNGDSPLTLPVIIPSALMAFILLSTGAVLFAAGVGSESVLNLFTGLKSSIRVLVIIGGLLALASVIYFVINCITTSGKPRDRHALSGFAVPLTSAILLAISYFDVTVSMNSPGKSLFHFSMILFMFWFLCELRAILGKPKPRAYFAFGMMTMLVSAVASLPWLIAFFAGKVSAPLYPTYLLYNIFSFGIFIYSAVRLTVFTSARSLLERIADQTPPKEEAESDEAVSETVETASEPDVQTSGETNENTEK